MSQQQQQQQHANINVPVNAQSHVQPLAQYHLAVPAPAGSQVLQLVSQAGLQIGDLLLIEQGTLREELMQVSGFGSILLGAPLRFDQAVGSQVVIARAYQPSQVPQFSSNRFETRQGDTTIGETELLPRMVLCLSLWTPSMGSLRTTHGATQKGCTRKSGIVAKLVRPSARR